MEVKPRDGWFARLVRPKALRVKSCTTDPQDSAQKSSGRCRGFKYHSAEIAGVELTVNPTGERSETTLENHDDT